MYNTPLNPLPICVASLIRCDSPPESVPARRESVKYVNPTLIRKDNLALISFTMLCAIFCSFADNLSDEIKPYNFVIDISQTSAIDLPSIFIESALGFKRLPKHSGQVSSLISL